MKQKKMKKEIRLIAMRATREEVASLGIELETVDKRDFDTYNYLCNLTDGSFMMAWDTDKDRECYQTFNKQIFLEACGMEEKYEITKEQILKYEMKSEFPECFEFKLKVGEWYFDKKYNWLFCFQGSGKAYGFNKGKYALDWSMKSSNGFIKATNVQFIGSLITEAMKRYEKPEHFDYEDNKLWMGGKKVFDNGIWTKIILEYTIQEAEETFKIKIK
jgi:hypothetical protein